MGVPKNKSVKKIVADLSGTIIIMTDGSCYTSGNITFRPVARYYPAFEPIEMDNKLIKDAQILSHKIIFLTDDGLIYKVWDDKYNVMQLSQRITEIYGNYFLLFMRSASNNIYLYTSYTPQPVCLTPYLNRVLSKAKEKSISYSVNDVVLTDLPSDILNHHIFNSLSYQSM